MLGSISISVAFVQVAERRDWHRRAHRIERVAFGLPVGQRVGSGRGQCDKAMKVLGSES